MFIGTAKPSLEEQQGVSHWGLDLVSQELSQCITIRTTPVKRLKKSKSKYSISCWWNKGYILVCYI